MSLKENNIIRGGFIMATKCRSCGATLAPNEVMCYCGIVSDETTQLTTVQEDNFDQFSQPEHSSNFNQFSQPTKPFRSRLGINIAAGIFAALNIPLLVIHNIILWGVVLEESWGFYVSEARYILIGLFLIAAIVFSIVTLVLSIVGLVNSAKHGFGIAGHILGIIAAVIVILTVTLFSVVSIILFILAAIFMLIQKKKQ